MHLLGKAGVEFVSTGGTQEFIEKLSYTVTPVEKLTGYPSIFGGRVKTLHPAIFGGILYRRDDAGDLKQSAEYNIPPIDLVIVDLYPFEETVAKGGSEEDTGNQDEDSKNVDASEGGPASGKHQHDGSGKSQQDTRYGQVFKFLPEDNRANQQGKDGCQGVHHTCY